MLQHAVTANVSGSYTELIVADDDDLCSGKFLTSSYSFIRCHYDFFSKTFSLPINSNYLNNCNLVSAPKLVLIPLDTWSAKVQFLIYVPF